MTCTGAVKFLADTFSSRSTAPVFLTALANTRGDPQHSPRKLLSREVAKLEAFINKWDQPGRAVYFCVATLKEQAAERSKATLAELVQLHLDIDFKSIAAAPAEVEKVLTELALPPNRIVRSGHGVHAYWWFAEALEATDANIADVEALLRRLADCLAGDRAVAECSRVMRVPGSHNSKDGDWLEVTLVDAQHDRPYAIAELESWLAELTPQLRRKSAEDSGTSSDPEDPFAALAEQQITVAPIAVDARLTAMRYHGAGDTAVHPTQVSVTAALLGRGMTLEDVVAKVLAATRAMAERDGLRWDWGREEVDLRGMCESWLRKHPDICALALVEDEERLIESARTGPRQLSKKQAALQRIAGPIGLHDFYAFLPNHQYVYVPTRDLWPGTSVDAVVPSIPIVDQNGQPVLDSKDKPKKVAATTWLDRNRRVEQFTWAPGFPQIIRDRIVTEGGWRDRRGACLFNLYLPPTLVLGDPTKAGRWLDLMRKVYPSDADHIIGWSAHRVQQPQVKVNHALFLGGAPGIGKDTILEALRQAVGAWNMTEISPATLTATSFNGYAKGVVLRVSEAHDTGNDMTRFQLYERLKIYAAAPPYTVRVNEKYVPEYHVLNVCGVVITSNYKTDGLYLPPDDRRTYVAWSEIQKEAFPKGYWDEFYAWYKAGGFGHVAAYLAAYDLSGFKARDPPLKTEAFWAIADANIPPEHPELLDAIQKLGNPKAFTLDDLRAHAIGELEGWLNDRRNRRIIPHRLELCGYVPVRNSSTKDGYWIVDGIRQPIYARASLAPEDRLKATKQRQKRK
jgi:hypothetical protein